VKVTDQLRKDADFIWQHLVSHPFVVELYHGDLPLEKFKFYILHDYYYLTTAMKNFSILAAKAPTVEDFRDILDILRLEAENEYEEYKKFLHHLGYSLQEAVQQEPIPISVSYGSFLLSTSTLKSYPEAITAVLPCFWSYAEIANYHGDKLHDNKNQLYTEWAKVYGTDSYRNLVEKIKKLVNRVEETYPYEKLLTIFTQASRYEYLFWNAAYNQERWPV
jgi:thiaminase/transcriptional activator TenA